MESYKGTIRNTLWLQKRPSPLMGACVIPAVLCRIAWSVLVWVSPFCILMHRHDLNSPGGTVERVIFPSDISLAKLLCLGAVLSSVAVTLRDLPRHFPTCSCPVPGRELPVGKVCVHTGSGKHAVHLQSSFQYLNRSHWGVFINKFIISFLILLICFVKVLVSPIPGNYY